MPKKSEHRNFERFALPILQKYAEILLLQDRPLLSIEYRSDLDDAGDRGRALFTYPYKKIVVVYGGTLLKEFAAKDFEPIKRTLVHELCHSITDPLYSKATSRYVSKDEILDEREALTDHITNIIIKNKLL